MMQHLKCLDDICTRVETLFKEQCLLIADCGYCYYVNPNTDTDTSRCYGHQWILEFRELLFRGKLSEDTVKHLDKQLLTIQDYCQMVLQILENYTQEKVICTLDQLGYILRQTQKHLTPFLQKVEKLVFDHYLLFKWKEVPLPPFGEECTLYTADWYKHCEKVKRPGFLCMSVDEQTHSIKGSNLAFGKEFGDLNNLLLQQLTLHDTRVGSLPKRYHRSISAKIRELSQRGSFATSHCNPCPKCIEVKIHQGPKHLIQCSGDMNLDIFKFHMFEEYPQPTFNILSSLANCSKPLTVHTYLQLMRDIFTCCHFPERCMQLMVKCNRLLETFRPSFKPVTFAFESLMLKQYTGDKVEELLGEWLGFSERD